MTQEKVLEQIGQLNRSSAAALNNTAGKTTKEQKIRYLVELKEKVETWGIFSINLKIAICECITKILNGDD